MSLSLAPLRSGCSCCLLCLNPAFALPALRHVQQRWFPGLLCLPPQEALLKIHRRALWRPRQLCLPSHSLPPSREQAWVTEQGGGEGGAAGATLCAACCTGCVPACTACCCAGVCLTCRVAAVGVGTGSTVDHDKGLGSAGFSTINTLTGVICSASACGRPTGQAPSSRACAASTRTNSAQRTARPGR